MTNLYTVDQLPSTSADAIRIFDERYLAALSAAPAPAWAREFGEVFDVPSPDVTFPIALLNLSYQATKGDSRFKDLGEEELRVKVVEYDAGAFESVLNLTTKVFSARKWAMAPSRFVIGEGRHICTSIAALLEAGESTDCWDGANFFDASHPANTQSGTATYSNYQASGSKSPTTLTDLEAEVTAMRGVLDENGKKLGVEPDTILLPTALFQSTYNKYAIQEIVAEASVAATNPFYGKFNVVHVPELTNTKDWYLVDSKLMKSQGLSPWAACRYAPSSSLGLRYYDESSDYFKDTGNIKVSSHIWYGFSLVMPHAIRKIDGG